jgi:hypothetical protein
MFSAATTVQVCRVQHTHPSSPAATYLLGQVRAQRISSLLSHALPCTSSLLVAQHLAVGLQVPHLGRIWLKGGCLAVDVASLVGTHTLGQVALWCGQVGRDSVTWHSLVLLRYKLHAMLYEHESNPGTDKSSIQ